MKDDTGGLMLKRTLGRSGIEVSALGLGCWAIGGPFWKKGMPVGWGEVDDEASIRAIHRGLDLGVNFFDTADVYGCGHSERVLGEALGGKRGDVVIATKFGQVFDKETRQATGYDTSPEHIRQACEASLRRLGTDHIDLYQLHVKQVEPDQAVQVRETLEALVVEGKIRFYGWSTDDPASARLFAEGPHCAAIQQQLNIFEGRAETLGVCEQFNLASIDRGPLGMGLLTGKFTTETRIPPDDVRSRRPALQEKRADSLEKLERIRHVLTEDGRSLAQGALGWLWARSEQTLPIPGFKTAAQIEENAGAAHFGPLRPEQMERIATLLGQAEEARG
jgi:aryl-alcohol dehydrogenase-like predicted oxidoreductase